MRYNIEKWSTESYKTSPWRTAKLYSTFYDYDNENVKSKWNEKNYHLKKYLLFLYTTLVKLFIVMEISLI